MPTYKFIYFNGRGRGEVTRYLLAAAGVDFEDHRLTFDSWPAVKPTVPYGTLPTLVEDGKQLGQSMAIAHYVAQRYGLLGDTAWEAAQINQIAMGVDDQRQAASPVIMAILGGKGDEAVATARQTYLDDAWPKHAARIEQFLAANGGDWVVGSRMSWADLAIAEWTDRWLATPEVQAHPALIAHHARVHQVPNIAKYVAERPKVPF